MKLSQNSILKFSILLLFLASTIVFSQKKALFIGNSYTAGMPNLVAQIASSAGDSLYVQHFWGGQTLEEVTGSESVFGEIRSREWDYVNIQEQSSRSHAELPDFLANSFPYAEMLNDSIKEHNECTQSVFYMIWAYRNGSAEEYPNPEYYAQQQNDSINYQKCADSLSGICAPAGEAWKQVSYEKPWLGLHEEDESHPNIFGMYLTASVYYTVFFEKSPEGLYHPPEIPDSTALFLQGIAANVVFDNIYKWRIGVDNPNNPPEIISPKDTIVDKELSVQLTWESITGIDSYDVQISLDESFDNIDTVYNDISSNSFTVVLDNYGTKYYFQVRANYSVNTTSCQTQWSSSAYFIIPFSGPELISPLDNAVCQPLSGELSWEELSIEDSYRIQIAKDESFEDIVIEEEDYLGTIYNYKLENELTFYYWRVQKHEQTVTKNWSETRMFRTAEGGPELLSPKDSITSVLLEDVVFIWSSDYPNADFHFQISLDSNFEEILIDMPNLESDTVIVSLENHYSNHYWRVAFVYDNCKSNWSVTRNFRTVLPEPILQSPLNGTEDLETPIEFIWSNELDMLLYEFQISDSSDFNNIIIQDLDIIGLKNTVNSLDKNKTYYWKVRSYNSYEQSQWSEARSFTTKGEAAAVPTLITPENESTKIAIDTILVWNKSPGAINYELQASLESDFETVIIESGVIQDTMYIASKLENFKTYFWRVRANNKYKGEWTQAYSFRTIAHSITDSPIQTYPEDKAEKLTDKIEFAWDAINYVEYYHLQVSLGDTFNDEIILDQDRITNLKYDSDIFNYKTTYYWRVRGINEAGNGPWSVVFSFTTDEFIGVDDEIGNSDRIMIYPNPGFGLFRIKSENLIHSKYSLFNVIGKQIILGEIRNDDMRIDISHLPAGVYVLMVEDKSFKIIKN